MVHLYTYISKYYMKINTVKFNLHHTIKINHENKYINLLISPKMDAICFVTINNYLLHN